MIRGSCDAAWDIGPPDVHPDDAASSRRFGKPPGFRPRNRSSPSDIQVPPFFRVQALLAMNDGTKKPHSANCSEKSGQ
jgi:hypothetical protein